LLVEADLPPGAHLPEGLLGQLLACYGIPTLPGCTATTAEAAVEAAEHLGMPVVLKVVAAGVTHKSDVGGVLLNLCDREDVAAGFEELRERLRTNLPGAHFEGVQVQPMAPPGQEVIVGVVRDPQFQALLMFGSGGVDVEGLRDVAFALAPATPVELERLLGDTWAGRKLAGYRNMPPADRAAALDVIARLGQMAADLPELAEIEINPLRVLEAGQGALALDVRAFVG
jgi:acyl-CoA synthetase (NDP forming)